MPISVQTPAHLPSIHFFLFQKINHTLAPINPSLFRPLTHSTLLWVWYITDPLKDAPRLPRSFFLCFPAPAGITFLGRFPWQKPRRPPLAYIGSEALRKCNVTMLVPMIVTEGLLMSTFSQYMWVGNFFTRRKGEGAYSAACPL